MKNVLSASSVNMYEFAPLLILLVFGMILAGILGIIEKLEAEQKNLKRVLKFLGLIIKRKKRFTY